MAPPERTPMLLFPCGHSFCRRCLETQRRKGGRNAACCPLCRVKAESIAENIPLRQLIERFVGERDALSRGEDGGDEAAAHNPEGLLDELTERISLRMRDELDRLAPRQQTDLADKIEDYLTSELCNTHTCQARGARASPLARRGTRHAAARCVCEPSSLSVCRYATR